MFDVPPPLQSNEWRLPAANFHNPPRNPWAPEVWVRRLLGRPPNDFFFITFMVSNIPPCDFHPPAESFAAIFLNPDYINVLGLKSGRFRLNWCPSGMLGRFWSNPGSGFPGLFRVFLDSIFFSFQILHGILTTPKGSKLPTHPPHAHSDLRVGPGSAGIRLIGSLSLIPVI